MTGVFHDQGRRTLQGSGQRPGDQVRILDNRLLPATSNGLERGSRRYREAQSRIYLLGADGSAHPRMDRLGHAPRAAISGPLPDNEDPAFLHQARARVLRIVTLFNDYGFLNKTVRKVTTEE
jgi:hypothetical protein